MNPTSEQLAIIKATNKYSLVIAGAGCGKSATIIKRIEYLVNALHVNKKDILVISFTNNTVNDIKQKLSDIDIVTFHKLALMILDNDVKGLFSDNDLNYYLNEFFKYNLNKYQKRLLNYYLDNDYSKLEYFYMRIKSILNIYKANDGNVLKLLNIYLKNYFNKKERYFIKLFYAFLVSYQAELSSRGLYDFNDLIIKASVSDNKVSYKYVIVDEFQDTSLIRMKLLNKVVKDNDASLLCVGDDYQSIYQFSGSNLKIFLNLKTYYPSLKTYYLTKTFRNSQELVNIAGLFIQKNPLQIKKMMKSDKHLKKPIVIIYNHDINKLINELDYPMVLGRNNGDNNSYPNFYTVHSSKGLESDNVILINNKDDYLGFPNQIINDRITTDLININEIKYAEERRLFYVALTRTRNKVYLLIDRDHQSCFVKELLKEYSDYIEIRKEE